MTPIQSLLGFAAWTLLLIAGVFLYRGMRFLTGTPINHWPRGNKPADDAPFVKRLEDAHANCLENLPVFAVIVLVAAALGRLADIQALAPWVLYARMGQSLAHLSGTGPVNVFVRASCWSVQLALFGWMLVKLLA
ncbi:MAG: MAPEG family protein [Burkholderiaceae bacterium]|nr:MAPEG family protein [Burkholderiaceae bacterium]